MTSTKASPHPDVEDFVADLKRNPPPYVDVEAFPTDTKEDQSAASKPAKARHNRRLHHPTPRAATILALSLLCIIALDILIGAPNSRPDHLELYEVAPLNLLPIPYLGAIYGFYVKFLPGVLYQVWLGQMLTACGVMPLSWRHLVIIFTVFTVGMKSTQWGVDALRGWVRVDLGVLGLWRLKDCFEMHGRKFCRDYGAEGLKYDPAPCRVVE